MRPNKQKLPSFASLDELVEFFDRHDMGEYEEGLPEARLTVFSDTLRTPFGTAPDAAAE